jgi:uncharacterized protein
MLNEYRDIITHMEHNNAANAHFLKIFERHNELDAQISQAEGGKLLLSDIEIEKLKKEKLRFKDEAFGVIMAYKKEQGL